MRETDGVRVLDAGDGCPELPIVAGEGVARAVVWPGVGATCRSLHRIGLGPGGRTRPLSHAMEAVYYVVAGSGVVLDPADAAEQALIEGSMVHVEPGTAYVFKAGPEGVEILGGPCPPDPALYAGL